MRATNCNSCIECVFLSVAASILVGIVTAIAQFTAIITLTAVFYIVAFGIAVLALLVLLALTPALYRTACQNCCNKNVKFATTGIIGTIVTSVILIAVGFAATSVLGAIVVGLLAFFFALLITSIVCTINCAANCEYTNNM